MSTNATPGALHGPCLTDVRDMVMAHDAFRRALDSGASLVGAVGDGDRKRAGVVADHLPMVFGLYVEVGDPEVTAQALAKAPAPLRLLLRLTARRAWRRYEARVFAA
ncbi:hypothetical protein [Nonomuraea basaltis]|uniref:hypothetical protein n=1 Tax=Nonomuraea basaltis TaxID=2495887 RepID=UPI00110C444D|nr:hypothetical protein [Nonomuraea basaltis]TMR93785.1 hypothetical protein EJK15_37480 [Nonomuraea basaltis]